MKYKILNAGTTKEPVELVNKAIGEGFIPVGAPFVAATDSYCFVIVRDVIGSDNTSYTPPQISVGVCQCVVDKELGELME